MTYTVSNLAKISGVSVRTLHWYDEIGLLKPAYRSSGGYRYYEEKELLKLQQVLFFRELGVPLERIHKLIDSSDFDTARALKIHKAAIEDEIKRKKKLIKTVDRTINYLEGTIKMKDEEFYVGFDSDEQKEYERYILKYGGSKAEDLVLESKKRTAKWTEEDYKSVHREGMEIYRSVLSLMKEGKKPSSPEVQRWIKKHVALTECFYDVTKDVYVGLSQMYHQHQGFVDFYAKLHPDLADFFSEAMVLYAEKHL